MKVSGWSKRQSVEAFGGLAEGKAPCLGNLQPVMGLGAILQTMVDLVDIAHVVDIGNIK